MNKLEIVPVATVLVCLYALVGAVLVILCAVGTVDPALRISFHDYLEQMALATAGLAVGRGIAARKGVAR